MDAADARALIALVIGSAPARWVDLGAGMGTFAQALATLLPAGSVVEAVDRDPQAVRTLARLAERGVGAVRIDARAGDLTQPGVVRGPLDGILLANALHFVAAERQGAVLRDLADALAPTGCLVVIEYDDRAASRWVPAPVPLARLRALMPASLAPPIEIGRLASAYGGTLYAARCDRRPADPGR